MAICPFCSCGCKYEIKNEKIIPKPFLCIKGFKILEYQNNTRRIKTPLIRKENGEFKEITFKKAYEILAEKIRESNKKAMIGSGKATNEECYVISKFARAVMKTPFVDHCVRMCHASSLPALMSTFGTAITHNSYEELKEDSELILIFGNNPKESQPYLFMQLLKSKAEIYVFDIVEQKPFKTYVIKPESDYFVLLFMLKCLGYEYKNVPFKYLEEKTGLKRCEVKELVEKIKKRKTTILYGMGITQNVYAIETITLMANLLILTDNYGKKGCGINPIRGQNNVQGACDMGLIPDYYPGYSKNVKFFEKFWKVNELPKPVCMYEGSYNNMDLLYIIGENTYKSLPLSTSKKMLESCDFIVVQDPIFNETAEYFADLYIPVCTQLEKEGTYTNTFRTIQYSEKIFNSTLPTDWQTLCKVAKLLNVKGFEYTNVKEIFEEIKKCVWFYRGFDYDKKQPYTYPIRLKPKLNFVSFKEYKEPCGYHFVSRRKINSFNTNCMLNDKLDNFVESNLNCREIVLNGIKFRNIYNSNIQDKILISCNSCPDVNKITTSEKNRIGEPLYKKTIIKDLKIL